MSDRARVTRRTLLIGGAGVVVAGAAAFAGVETGVLPGRSTLHRLLGLDGPAGAIPKTMPGPSVSGSFISDARLGATCGWKIAYPPGSSVGDEMPVLVVLHGYSDDHTAAFDKLGLDRFQADQTSRGAAPYAIASVDAGNSYYHPRKSGEDAGAMVTDEFLPLLADKGLNTDRLAIMGWSMGGYGALLLASKLGADRVASVIAESPAMWVDGAHSPSGAFDDADDYAAHDLAGRQSELDGIPAFIVCGTGDGFYPVVRDYVAGFTRRPAGRFEPGGHDYAYWRRMAPQELAYVTLGFA